MGCLERKLSFERTHLQSESRLTHRFDGQQALTAILSYLFHYILSHTLLFSL
jgi:hypothetical protein